MPDAWPGRLEVVQALDCPVPRLHGAGRSAPTYIWCCSRLHLILSYFLPGRLIAIAIEYLYLSRSRQIFATSVRAVMSLLVSGRYLSQDSAQRQCLERRALETPFAGGPVLHDGRPVGEFVQK